MGHEMRLLTAFAVTALLAPGARAATYHPDYPRDFRAAGQAYFQDNLRDAKGSDITLVRGPAWSEFPLLFITVRGWSVCYRVNARNGYGGFLGPGLTVLVFKNGQPFQSFAEGAAGIMMDRAIERDCARQPVVPDTGPAAASPPPSPAADLSRTVGGLVADGKCGEARAAALRAGDLDLAAKVDTVCAAH